jgi:hypothetical protein
VAETLPRNTRRDDLSAISDGTPVAKEQLERCPARLGRTNKTGPLSVTLIISSGAPPSAARDEADATLLRFLAVCSGRA